MSENLKIFDTFKYYYVLLRNMVLIGKISRGSRMDQVYISKERAPGFEVGATVLIQPVLEKAKPALYYYSIKHLEPVKVAIVEEVFNYLKHVDNVIIAGSFIEEGFDFEDIDVIVVTEESIDIKSIENHFKSALGIKVHIILLNFKTLLKGIHTDPLFQMLTSKFISRERTIFKTKNVINYKLLDLHLLKSELLITNFYFLTGREKYKFVRNLFAIILFLHKKIISLKSVDKEINRCFGKDSVRNIKENLVDKSFLAKYEKLYENTFKLVINGVKNGPKQKQTD